MTLYLIPHKKLIEHESSVFPRCGFFYKIFTALAASRAITNNEIIDCSIIKTFAQRDRTGTSVGEKAVEVLNARKR